VSDFALTSDAFGHGDEIPRRHTCEGDDVSPALSWSDPPAGTGALALVVDDPDAPVGTFTHWLAANIDPEAGALAEGASAPVEGRNDFGRAGWRGPCPPPGHGAHRYFFRLHASTRRSTSAPAPAAASSTGRSRATCLLPPSSWARTSAEKEARSAQHPPTPAMSAVCSSAPVAVWNA
jgi:Raf kinase inhibitor-like YbhB/YbcL family protein